MNKHLFTKTAIKHFCCTFMYKVEKSNKSHKVRFLFLVKYKSKQLKSGKCFGLRGYGRHNYLHQLQEVQTHLHPGRQRKRDEVLRTVQVTTCFVAGLMDFR